MRAAPTDLTANDRLLVRPWLDPVVDRLGHDPRSPYVEAFWLGVLGPSTTWLLRRIADGLDADPDGFPLPLHDTARALGLGGEGRSSPFVRALLRCCQFDLARPGEPGTLEVRRTVPPLNRRQLARLPESVQDAHQRWLDAALHAPTDDRVRHRTRRLALSLLELGENRDQTERQLLRWRFHPVLARESAHWAWQEFTKDLAVPADLADRHPAAAGGTLPGPSPEGPTAA